MAVENPVLRPIGHADRVALEALIRSVQAEFGADAPEACGHDAALADLHTVYTRPGAAYLVIEAGGRLLGGGGYAPLAGVHPPTCELQRMYLQREARGQGLGRALLVRLLGMAVAEGYSQCYLETMPAMHAARALYRACGFEPQVAPSCASSRSACSERYLRRLR